MARACAGVRARGAAAARAATPSPHAPLPPSPSARLVPLCELARTGTALRLTGSEGRRGRRRFWQLWRRGGFLLSSLTPERREAHTLRWSPTAASRRHAPSLPPSHAALVVAPGRGGVWLPRCASPQKPTHHKARPSILGLVHSRHWIRSCRRWRSSSWRVRPRTSRRALRKGERTRERRTARAPMHLTARVRRRRTARVPCLVCRARLSCRSYAAIGPIPPSP